MKYLFFLMKGNERFKGKLSYHRYKGGSYLYDWCTKVGRICGLVCIWNLIL